MQHKRHLDTSKSNSTIVPCMVKAHYPCQLFDGKTINVHAYIESCQLIDHKLEYRITSLGFILCTNDTERNSINKFNKVYK